MLGPGRSAEMTYYETPRGAKVFAAGTLNFAASIDEPPVSRLVDNVWARLSRPYCPLRPTQDCLVFVLVEARPVLRPRCPAAAISRRRSGGLAR